MISAPSLSKSMTSANVSQVSADVTVNGVTLKQNEAKLPKSYNRTVVPQTQGEATQVVTILPTPVKLPCLQPLAKEKNDYSYFFN